jgi:hypothetical protein
MAPSLRVEGLTDADFNARAPLHPDEVPTAREIRLRHNTWMAVGFFVSTFWLHVDGLAQRFFIPVGFVLAVIMGLLIRDTARTARESFALPLFLLIALVGSVIGVVTLVKGWGL